MTNPTNWLELGLQSTQATALKGDTVDNQRAKRSINAFCSWATDKIPFPAPPTTWRETLEKYEQTLDDFKKASGKYNRNGEAMKAWAAEMLKRSSVPVQETPVSVTGAVQPPDEDEEDEMRNEEAEDEFAPVEAEEEFEEEVEEEERPRPRRVVERPLPRQQRRGGRRAAVAPAGRNSPVDRLFSNSTQVRIEKRDERGKMVHCEDFDAKDFGNLDLQTFIEDVVHPRYGNQGMGFTDYIASKVTADGRVTARSQVIRVEEEQQEQSNFNDPFMQVERAADFIGRVKQTLGGGMEQDPGFKAAAQQKMMNGDFSGFMQMMLMQKVMGGFGGENELLLKILEKLERKDQPSPPPPPQLPPWMMAPPPQPQQNHMTERVFELALANMMKPPPSIFQQAQDMATVRQLFGGESNSELASVKNELASLKQFISTPKQQGGIEGAFEMFEKLQTFVKSNVGESGGGSGIAGFVKGLLSPEVGKAIASAIAGAPPPGQQQPPQQQGQPQQAPQQQVRNPAQPPNPPPPTVVDAVKVFQQAQTIPVAAEKFADYVFAMYMSQDPYYLSFLNPVIAELNKEPWTVDTLKPARSTVLRLVVELRPQLASPEFADKCISALAAKASVNIPEVFTKTYGLWTLDFTGNVIMLGDVAKPVVANAALPAQAEAPKHVPPEAMPKPPENFPTAIPPAEPLSVAPPDRPKRAIELEEETPAPAATPPANVPPAIEVLHADKPPLQLVEVVEPVKAPVVVEAEVKRAPRR